MKLIKTIWIILLLPFTLQSQNLIAELRESNTAIYKSEYIYNDENQRIAKIFSRYFIEEDTTIYSTKTEWKYEGDRLAGVYEYQFKDSVWFLKIAYSKSFINEGCITEENQRFYIRPNEWVDKKITMTNSFDCGEPWQNRSDHSFLPDSPKETKLTRLRTDSSEIEIYDEYKEETDEWIRKGIVERKYNAKGNLLEDFSTLSFFGYAGLNRYTYDESGERLTKLEVLDKNKIDDDWRLFTQYEYFYENEVLRKIITGRPGTVRFEEKLEYYCDELLKKNTKYDFYNESSQIRTYEYDQKIDETENCEQLEQLSLNIYPNPTTGIFYIESEIFQLNASEIFVYDLGGKLLHRQKVQERVPRVRIDFEPNFMMSPMLIVHLISEGGVSISSKVLTER